MEREQDREERIKYLEEVNRIHSESLTLLASLNDFQSSINECRDPLKILGITRFHAQRFLPFHATAFCLVNEEDLSFPLHDCEPVAEQPAVQKIISDAIKEGTFAWALRQNHSVMIRNKKEKNLVILHVLATRSRVIGMFVGVLSDHETKSIDVFLHLLSIVLLNSAYALENLALYNEINVYNQNLEKTVALRTQELSKTNEELIKAKKLESIATLAGGIAHDFNNMLMVILGNISLAKGGLNPAEKPFQRLEQAEKASQRARELTRQLLTFSKGGAPLKKVMHLSSLLQDSTDFALRGSNILCELKIAANLLPVEIDEQQIRQCVMQMVLNSVQAMPGAGTIRLSAENTVLRKSSTIPLPDGKYVKISIEDSGVGIPPEHLGKIFDPYFTTKQGKSGFGLAIAYSIVTKHRGYITIESEPGIRTTFSIYLPASPNKPMESEPVAKPTPPTSSTREKKARILVMDDEEPIRLLLGEMLSGMGHDVEFSKDGEEAIGSYRKAKNVGKPFDLLIMDLTVPAGMGGKDAVHQILQFDPQAKAIISSGYSNDEVISEYKKHGFRGFVAKPYELPDLQRAIQAVI